MSESKVGSGDSLKDGMLFDGNEMKGKAGCFFIGFNHFFKSGLRLKEKEKRFCRSQEKMYIGVP